MSRKPLIVGCAVWGTVIMALAVFLASHASAIAAAIPDIRTFSPTPAPLPPSLTQPPKDWHQFMETRPTPKAGCYTATYPSTEWQEVPCSTAPPQPHPLSCIAVNCQSGSGLIYSGGVLSAVGSFYSVTGVTSESNVAGSTTTLNVYSLQLNTNLFPAAALCPSSVGCVGWQQYIYDNQGSSSQVYIQYWLFGFLPDGSCPTSALAGHSWTYYNGAGGGAKGCYVNGNQTPVANQTIANFPALRLFGFANANAHMVGPKCGNSQVCQAADLETSLTAYGAMDDVDLLGIGSNWNTTEYNVVGGCCVQTASFNPGSTIVVQLDVFLNQYAGAVLPACLNGGYTAETNNLSFVAPCCPVQLGPGLANRILFTQSNAVGATSICNCPGGSFWGTNEQACITPQQSPQNPVCFSGFEYCSRLKECVTPGIFASLCTFKRPIPPPG